MVLRMLTCLVAIINTYLLLRYFIRPYTGVSARGILIVYFTWQNRNKFECIVKALCTLSMKKSLVLFVLASDYVPKIMFTLCSICLEMKLNVKQKTVNRHDFDRNLF